MQQFGTYRVDSFQLLFGRFTLFRSHLPYPFERSALKPEFFQDLTVAFGFGIEMLVLRSTFHNAV